MLLFFCIGNAYADTFKIGVEEINYFPHYMANHGEYTGYARELLDAFAAQNGYKFEYVILPIKRLSATYFDEQLLDFKFPDNPNWMPGLREGKNVYYSDTVISVTEGLMVLPKNKGKGLGAIKNIGTIIGFTPRPYQEQINNGSIKVYENPSFDGLIRQALIGRVDAAYIDIEVGSSILDRTFKLPGQLVFDPDLPHVLSRFSLSSIAHPDVIRQFNDFLTKEKTLQSTLKEKYGMVN